MPRALADRFADLLARISAALDPVKLLPARRPLAVLAVAGALTLVLGFQARLVTVDSSSEKIYEEGDPELPAYEAFRREFGDDEIIVVTLGVAEGGDVFRKPVLEEIRRITDAIEALPADFGVDRVFSLTNVDDVRAAGDEGFRVERLIGARIPDDPAALARIRAQAFENPLYVRNLVSADGRAAAINVFLVSRPEDTTMKERLVYRLREIVGPRPPAAVEEVHFAGIPALTAYIGDYLRRDMSIFVPGTILVMALSLYYAHRRVAAMLLPLLTVGVACIWMLGIVGTLGGSISIASSVVPSLILAVGCAEVIHVLGQYGAEPPDDPRRLEHTLRHVFGPVLVAGVTTVIGFGSMMTYDVAMIREFGQYSALGLVASTALALFAVPAAIRYVLPRGVRLGEPSGRGEPGSGSPPPPQDRPLRGRPLRALQAVARFDLAHPFLVLGISAASIALGWIGIRVLNVDTDYSSYFKPDSIPARAVRFTREAISGERPLNVVVRARGENGALEPEVLAYIERLERKLREHPLIGTTISIAGYLKNMNEAWHGDNPAAHCLPATRGLAVNYIDIYGRPGELARFLNHDRSAANIIARSGIISSEEFLEQVETMRRFAAETRPAGVEVTVTGSMYHVSKASIAVARKLAQSFGVASLLVLAVMAILFRSLSIGLISMIPNVMPVVWCYALMGFAGIDLTVGTSVGAAIVLGVAVDDTIHLLSHYQHERFAGFAPAEAMTRSFAVVGRPILITTFTNFAGFLVLALSSFRPLVALGWLTAVTMLTSLVADLVMLPALLIVFDRTKYAGPRADRVRDEERLIREESGEREAAARDPGL